jgi:hypothetical protein
VRHGKVRQGKARQGNGKDEATWELCCDCRFRKPKSRQQVKFTTSSCSVVPHAVGCLNKRDLPASEAHPRKWRWDRPLLRGFFGDKTCARPKPGTVRLTNGSISEHRIHLTSPHLTSHKTDVVNERPNAYFWWIEK